MTNTRHYGAMGIIASIIAPVLTGACGVPVDPMAVNSGMAISVGITLLDWIGARIKEYKQK